MVILGGATSAADPKQKGRRQEVAPSIELALYSLLCPKSFTKSIISRSSSEQRAASSKQRTASSEQRAANSEQRAASSEQRAASSEQRAASQRSELRGSKIDARPVVAASVLDPPHSFQEAAEGVRN